MVKFKKARESVRLTQNDVASQLGIGRTAISMWESGESLPRAELLPKLAALYGCTVDELLADERAGPGEDSA